MVVFCRSGRRQSKVIRMMDCVHDNGDNDHSYGDHDADDDNGDDDDHIDNDH